MPLSKDKQAKWMREYRKRLGYNVIPKTDSLQSNSSPLKDISNIIAPPELDASGEIIPEYW